jgi:hypothetical protein
VEENANARPTSLSGLVFRGLFQQAEADVDAERADEETEEGGFKSQRNRLCSDDSIMPKPSGASLRAWVISVELSKLLNHL